VAGAAAVTPGTTDLVLGIETSCDETAAAVVDRGAVVRSSVVSSQVELHARYGGVVPELAGRAHLERLTGVVAEALERADVGEPRQLRAVAVTYGPGLVGSLLVGLAGAKALSMAWDVPLVGVNHLEGHLFAALLERPDLRWPLVVLLVSGGHTILVRMDGPGRYRVLGQTLDDAAGEAYDKVARYLGLGYPGGPALDRAAADGDPTAFAFPRALLADGYDFSFSGLKTSVVRTVERHPDAATADVAASFQQAVTDVLVAKARRAVADVGASGLCLAGGVAANSLLRRVATEACAADGVDVYLPSLAMCTDNAAMVAAAGWWRLSSDGPSPLSLGAAPNLALPQLR
jgi:N6-L-threonylcarbamoyladenine synthase